MQERLDGRAASKVGAFGAIHGHFRVSRGLWRRNRLRNEQAFQARRQWNTCLYSLSFNALAETVNGLYKTELIYARPAWPSVTEVEFQTMNWVYWWNTKRLHEALIY